MTPEARRAYMAAYRHSYEARRRALRLANPPPTTGESVSVMIDRLIIGRPAASVLNARIVEMMRAGWFAHEIAQMYGLTEKSVLARAYRERRRRRGTP